MSQADHRENTDNEIDRKSSSPGNWGCIFVCLLIIVGMVFLWWPATRAAKEAAPRFQCSNNIKQISLALHTYHDKFGSLPPAYTMDENGNPLHSWRVLILPYFEQKELYESIRLDEPWDSEYNSRFHTQMPRGFCCVSMSEKIPEGLTSYKWVIGPDTISDGPNARSFGDVTAGISNVIGVIEVIPSTCWMAPVDIQQSDLSPELSFSRESGIGSRHRRSKEIGINVGYLDGSVQYFPNDKAGQLSEKVKIKR